MFGAAGSLHYHTKRLIGSNRSIQLVRFNVMWCAGADPKPPCCVAVAKDTVHQQLAHLEDAFLLCSIDLAPGRAAVDHPECAACGCRASVCRAASGGRLAAFTKECRGSLRDSPVVTTAHQYATVDAHRDILLIAPCASSCWARGRFGCGSKNKSHRRTARLQGPSASVT